MKTVRIIIIYVSNNARVQWPRDDFYDRARDYVKVHRCSGVPFYCSEGDNVLQLRTADLIAQNLVTDQNAGNKNDDRERI